MAPVTTGSARSPEVGGVVRAALEALERAGTASASAAGDALEGAARSLARRMVAGAPAGGKDLSDPHALHQALAAKSGAPTVGSATTAAVALRLGARFGRLRFVVRRTPAFLVATALPALVASVTRGAEELGMVSAHLLGRARTEGVEPDPERVRRAAVQVVTRRPVDPATEPSHRRLVSQWFRRAVRAALPFTSGVATADPGGLAAAAAAVDVDRLGPT